MYKKVYKSYLLWGIFIVCVFSGILHNDKIVMAVENTVTNGVFIGDIDLGGLTKEEAVSKANEYINGFTSKTVELDADGNKETVTVGELGYYWKNTNVIEEAYSHCKKGNVISRYKEAKDIEQNNIKYDFEVDVDDQQLNNTVVDKCGQYNIPHVNAKLTRVDGGFTVSKEASGRMIDMDKTITSMHEFLLKEWKGDNTSFNITMIDDNPIATVADCEKVKDIIGSFSTTFSISGGNYNRNCNMENGVKLLNAVTLCQGEVFSANELLEPWTTDNGWKEAGTYVNGKVENSLGGGICQVSTTLYNAVLNAELEVVERYNHSMSVGYVPLSQDAALAGTWKDLKFKNNTDTPVYVEGIYDGNGKITFNIYGVETRSANRRIEYVSETTGTSPAPEVIREDPSLPAGYRKVTDSGHTGYTARLIKRVYVDGNLESEEVVNKSTYGASTRYVTVGTGEAQPAVEQPQETAPAEQPMPETPQTEPQTNTNETTSAPQPAQQPTNQPASESESKSEEAKPEETKPEETTKKENSNQAKSNSEETTKKSE